MTDGFQGSNDYDAAFPCTTLLLLIDLGSSCYTRHVTDRLAKQA